MYVDYFYFHVFNVCKIGVLLKVRGNFKIMKMMKIFGVILNQEVMLFVIANTNWQKKHRLFTGKAEVS